MSWFERARAGVLLAGMFGLSGCFQPLYSEAAHPGVAQAVKAVEIVPVDGRLGHYLTDDLITQLNGTGETVQPKYRLQINVGQSRTTPTVELQIAFASSATVTETADIVLIEIGTSKIIYQGQAAAIAPYDLSFNDYSNLRAGRDADLRLARSLSDEIAQRVAAAIASKS